MKTLNFKEYTEKINEFFSYTVNQDITKGKDKEGNYIYISKKEKYILYPPKYINIFKYIEKLEKEENFIYFNLENIKNSLFIDTNNSKNNLKNSINYFFSQLEKIKIIKNKINEYIKDEYLEFDNKKQDINLELKNLSDKLKDLFEKKQYIYNLNRENWNELNSEYLLTYNKYMTLNKDFNKINKKKLNKEMMIEEPKIEFIKSYTKDLFLSL